MMIQNILFRNKSNYSLVNYFGDYIIHILYKNDSSRSKSKFKQKRIKFLDGNQTKTEKKTVVIRFLF
jgi:hypothetical protein